MPTFAADHPSLVLFRHMNTGTNRVTPYPAGVVTVPEQIEDTSFFPGGSGLWCQGMSEAPTFPLGGVMILGHDFHSEEGYEWAKENVAANLETPTWRHLQPLLKTSEVCLADCFFTNVFMGLRTGTATTGQFPGATDQAFVGRCQKFFVHQVNTQRPRLIVALGAHVPSFLAPLSRQLDGWRTARTFRQRDEEDLSLVPDVQFDGSDVACTVVSMVHPSYRPSNISRRRWRGEVGDAAEIGLLREGLRLSGITKGNALTMS